MCEVLPVQTVSFGQLLPMAEVVAVVAIFLLADAMVDRAVELGAAALLALALAVRGTLEAQGLAVGNRIPRVAAVVPVGLAAMLQFLRQATEARV